MVGNSVRDSARETFERMLERVGEEQRRVYGESVGDRPRYR